MNEREPGKTIILSDNSDTSIVCPFTQPQGNRIGDALLALMFVVVPILLLLYFVSIQI